MENAFKDFKDNLYAPVWYSCEDFEVLTEVLEAIYPNTCIENKKDPRQFYNIACSFDIETTSFFEKEGRQITPKQWAKLSEKTQGTYKKRACMWVWMFGINGVVFYGRTWSQFTTFCKTLSIALKLSPEKILIVYVHNLSFEMQWIKGLFDWNNVFATELREPLYALTKDGICFKCSYRMTDKSLAELGNSLIKYPIKKMVGDLDYDKLRHSQTNITAAEEGYCRNDVKVVMSYIQEQIEAEKYIHYIPLTKTGYIRRYIRDLCFTHPSGDPKKTKNKKWRYWQIMKEMQLTVNTYDMLLDATQGGFCHGNPLYYNVRLENLISMDLSSAYPGHMVGCYYPVSTPKKRTITSTEQIKMYLNNYCCLFTIDLFNVQPKFKGDSYIQVANCHILEGARINNGRVYSADHLSITITELDFQIMRDWYTWDTDKTIIYNFYTMIRGYLPYDLIIGILKLFEDKTSLKGVEGREADYMRSKEMLNSSFGMCLTKIWHKEIVLDEHKDWHFKDDGQTKEEAIDKYNAAFQRFLFFAWGTWVTAHTRRTITKSIMEIGEDDYVYSDTDSIKFLNPEKHLKMFDRLNEDIRNRIKRTLKYYKIPENKMFAKTITGKEKTLGIFEIDGEYKEFKMLGAKRYMYTDDTGIHITVAGLSKKLGGEYIKRTFEDPYKAFCDKLFVPALETGKLTHTYIDESFTGFLKDYEGKEGSYTELSAVHLAPCEFNMSISNVYEKFVRDFFNQDGSF